MAAVVIMPKQGQSVESCILTGITKKKGDTVAIGDILFTYETDKASFEEEAKVAGTVLEIFYDEGDEIPVLMNVMVIGNPGESTEEFRQDGETVAMEIPLPPSKAELNPSAALLIAPTSPTSSASPVSPRANMLAEKHAVRASSLSGTGPQGRVLERDVQAYIDALPRTSPLAKAMIQKDNLSVIPETGSGLAGMIKGSDLSVLKINADESGSQIIPLSNIRKRTAKAMHTSLQNAAQLTHHLGADARRILSLRKQVKEAVTNGYQTDITLNDMICHSAILAIKQYPQVNAHFLGDSVRLFSGVHLGFAVDTMRGLMVPVVKNADDLSMPELASRLKEIANTCRKGSINPDLLASEAASFTVTNLGSY